MRTSRDKQIQLMAIRFMIRQYRSNPTQNTAGNIARFFSQRRHVTYDFSPIPCPIWTI